MAVKFTRSVSLAAEAVSAHLCAAALATLSMYDKSTLEGVGRCQQGESLVEVAISLSEEAKGTQPKKGK